MSASLVGSEMCIRDSLANAASQALPGTSHNFLALPRRPAMRAVLRLAAVSYTHLTLPTICSV
eukprot:4851916-Alexandrium_andersonii.AAC.1